ncbi:cytochrome P450 [Rhypophila decipiens]
MGPLADLLSWRNAALAAALYSVYFVSLVFYRLFLHPLASFPGPKRAAATYLYEGYHDVVRNGQYTFRIAELHKKYGPIIRINPNELHVIDPSFYKVIYRHDGIWNKDPWAYSAQPPRAAAIMTVAHHQHKARRSPFNGYFSKAKIATRQDMLHRHLGTLCDRIEQFADSSTTFDLGHSASAFTRDVGDEYILGLNFHNLEQHDFNRDLTNMLQSVGYIWRTNKQMPFIYLSTIMMSIPQALVMLFADAGTRSLFRYLNSMREITERTMKEWSQERPSTSPSTADPESKKQSSGSQRTIIHEVLDSNLPPSDKQCDRIWDETTTITGAGFETTANIARSIYFHLWSNPAMLRRARQELASHHIPYEIAELDVKALEKLPYLTAIICEGMRLSPGISTRMGRVAPDRDIIYREWVIPKGYTVGMTTLLMHLDEELYPDPKQFRPERWVDGPDGVNARKVAEGNGTFAPFSRGTRICLGIYLAWAELYLLLTALIQRFDFEFAGAKAEDFLCTSDQFVIGTDGGSELKSKATRVKN